MNNQQKAQKIREALLAMPPGKRSKILEPASSKLDLNEIPHHEDTMNYIDGMGDVSMKEMVLSVALWLLDKDITTFTPKYPEDW